jgi:hypothetical protein
MGFFSGSYQMAKEVFNLDARLGVVEASATRAGFKIRSISIVIDEEYKNESDFIKTLHVRFSTSGSGIDPAIEISDGDGQWYPAAARVESGAIITNLDIYPGMMYRFKTAPAWVTEIYNV